MALSVEEVEKLRAAGFSDEEITAYDKESGSNQQLVPVDPTAPPVAADGLPTYDVNVAPPPTITPPSNTFTETMLGVLPGVKEGLITGAELYGLVKAPGLIQRGFDAWKESSRAKISQAEADKMSEEGRRMRSAAKAEGDMLKAEELNLKNNDQRVKNEQLRQAQTRTAERPVIFRQQAPGVTPGAGGQVPVQQPPSAANYMQRMNNLAEQYRTVGPVVNPPAQPAPVQQAQPQPTQPAPNYRGQSGMTYRPIQGGGGMRGGGGGGGGGGMGPFDPNKRWRPMQF